MSRPFPDRMANLNDAPRCGARTRAGRGCRCPAMPNGKCRIHGGLSPGGPHGVANGRFKDGYWTRESVEERRWLASIVRTYGKLGQS
jgi:hypothetical protein